MTRYLLAALFTLGLRPLPCAQTVCAEEFQADLAAAQVPVIDDARIERGYQQTILTMIRGYSRTHEDWYLNAALRTLTDYAHDYPAGRAWELQLRAQMQAVRTVTPTEHRPAVKALRRQIEAMIPEDC
jgi:hypothetical protein